MSLFETSSNGWVLATVTCALERTKREQRQEVEEEWPRIVAVAAAAAATQQMRRENSSLAPIPASWPRTRSYSVDACAVKGVGYTVAPRIRTTTAAKRIYRSPTGVQA